MAITAKRYTKRTTGQAAMAFLANNPLSTRSLTQEPHDLLQAVTYP
jgi:hypothetical protein